VIKILIPLVFLCAGLGIGVGAAKFTAPSEAPDSKAKATDTKAKTDEKKPTKDMKAGEKGEEGSYEYLKLTKQFVVPVVERDEIAAMVTMTLSLEAEPGLSDQFYAIEPKLRDRFLQVLFDHANTGGFDGIFTQSDNLATLRKSLLEVARKDLGNSVSQVLIMSVNRQDT